MSFTADLSHSPDNFVFNDKGDTPGETLHHEVARPGLIDGAPANDASSILAALLQTDTHASGHDASAVALGTGEHVSPADVSKQALLEHGHFLLA